MNTKPFLSGLLAIATVAVMALFLPPSGLVRAQGQVGQITFSGHVLTCEDTVQRGIPDVKLTLEIRTNTGKWQVVDTTLTNEGGAFALSHIPSDSSQHVYRVIEESPFPSCSADTDIRVFFQVGPGDSHSGIEFRDQWSTPTPTRTSTLSPAMTPPPPTSRPTRTPTPTAPLTIWPTPTYTATGTATPSPTNTATATCTATQIHWLQLPLVCKAYPQTWKMSGLAGQALKSAVIDPSNSQFLHAGTSDGLWRRFYCDGEWYETSVPAAGIYALAIAQAPSGHVYAGTWGNGVYRSVDAGVTWLAINEGIDCPYINALTISPNYELDQTIYAGTNTEGVYRSQNGGIDWHKANEGLTSLEISSLAIHPQDPQWLLAGTFDQGIFRSDNGGATWVRCPIGNDIIWCIAISASHPDVVYAGTDGGVFRSDNAGLGWMATTLGIKTYSLAINPRNPLHVFAGTSGSGVYATNLGGLGWSAMSEGLTSRVIQSLALDTDACNALYAGTNDGIWQWSLD